MQAVVETPSYLADAERMFSREGRMAIGDRLAAAPRCGVVIPSSGGIRKVRFGFGARGKSGGARVIYVFSGDEPARLCFGCFRQERESQPLGSRTKCAS